MYSANFEVATNYSHLMAVTLMLQNVGRLTKHSATLKVVTTSSLIFRCPSFSIAQASYKCQAADVWSAMCTLTQKDSLGDNTCNRRCFRS